MSQLHFKSDYSGETIPELTKLERLYKLRERYHKQLLDDIETYKTKMKDTLASYKNTVKEIDDEIHKELNKNLRGVQ